MTRTEFIELVDAGNDVMFECVGKNLAIVMTASGPDIAEQTTCANRRTFQSGKQLLDEYLIDGTPLADLLPRCRITFCS